MDTEVQDALLRDWRARFKEQWETRPVLGLDAKEVFQTLEPYVPILLDNFERLTPEGYNSSQFAQSVYEDLLRHYDDNAMAVLALLIHTAATAYQDRFDDFDGVQYRRLISPDAILGDRAAFRRLSKLVHSDYVSGGALREDYSFLVERRVALDDPVPWIDQLKQSINPPRLTKGNIESLLAFANAQGDLLEEVEEHIAMPSRYLRFITDMEDNLQSIQQGLMAQALGR